MKIHDQLRVLVGRGQGLRFTESPRWHAGKFWFLDIHGNAIRTVDLHGHLETVLDLPFKPNGFGIRDDGTFVFADALQRQIYEYRDGALSLFADLRDSTVFCLSDGILDPAGRFYIGDIGYNFFDPQNTPVHTCVIACVDRDGSHRIVARDLSFPNGMAITADGNTLLIAECMGTQITAYHIEKDGALSEARTYARLPEGTRPDGIALDAEGAVWLANPEGECSVLRVREGGEVVDAIQLDTHAYAVALGGPHGKHLLICTSESHSPVEIANQPSATLQLIEVDVPVAGFGT